MPIKASDLYQALLCPTKILYSRSAGEKTLTARDQKPAEEGEPQGKGRVLSDS